MKIKNVILKSILYLSLFVLFFCISCLDSKVNYPFYIGILLSGGYIVMFCIANKL